MRMSVLAVCLVILLSSLGAQTWTQRSPATVPPALEAELLHARGATVQTFLRDFGNRLYQVWRWKNGDWSMEAVNGQGAPWHIGNRAAYLAASDRVVLTGGVSPPFTFVDKLWVFDGASNAWAEVASGGPGALSSPALARDPLSARILLFGGGSATGVRALSQVTDGGPFATLAPAHMPPARGSHAMVLDPGRKVLVLFGGSGASSNLGDTWEWDGTDWTEVLPAHSPSPRINPKMAFHAGRGTVILYGGTSGSFTDTWEYDGVDWTQIASSGPSDSPLAGMAYDGNAGELVWVSSFPVETWTLSTPVAAKYDAFGAGCPGSAGVPVLAPAAGSLPRVDGTFTLQLTNLPVGNAGAFVIFGFSDTSWGGIPLPADLTPFGIWGCTGYLAVEVAFPVATSGGTAQLSLPVPNDGSLVGLSFYNQGLVSDPGVNFFGAVVSNAGRGTISPK